MFWRWRKSDEDEDDIEEGKEVTLDLPPLEKLENWVLQLVIKLKLKPGEFTFLPGYGGVLLFIKSQGISWIPYPEIKDALGEVQKGKLFENTATLGGVAAVAATGGSILPVIAVHRLIKGSYRMLAKPSPSHSMSFLLSLIDKVIIEEKPLAENLLNTFEHVPFNDENTIRYSTAKITIRRKFLDDKAESTPSKIIRNVKTFFIGNSDPVFAIPPQSDVKIFATLLRTHGVEVEHIVPEKLEVAKEERYEVEDLDDDNANHNQ